MSKKNVTGRATILDDPNTFVAGAMALGGAGAAIDAQQKLGADDVKYSDRFPLKREGVSDEQLTALGFVLGPKIDDLFQSVKLPPGWSKTNDDGGYWTSVLDTKKRQRFNLFYKSAVYDREAFAHTARRFRVTSDYDAEKKTKKNTVIVLDGNTEIHRIVGVLEEKEFKYGDEAGRQQKLQWYEEGRSLQAQAATWLAAKYPQWEDWTAHWND